MISKGKHFVSSLTSSRLYGLKLGSIIYQKSMEGWNCLSVPSRDEVEISTVLTCGQSFRWKPYKAFVYLIIKNAIEHEKSCMSEKGSCKNEKPLESDNSCWIGVFAHRVWILQQQDTKVYFKVFPMEKDVTEVDKQKNQSLLHNYFQLDVSLKSLYKDWSMRDKEFAKLTLQDYRGIRILSQDCVENVFSFICSSNNNIARIGQMVEKLCTYYGEEIAVVEGKSYHDFPRVENLTGLAVEKKLRDEKFGYRAGFIAKSASLIVQNGGLDWLENLRTVGYDEARRQLQTLPGIGRKVADCICLMSLGYPQAIPIDTHMQQIAKKYLPHLPKTKTLTDKTYSEITECFRKLHGEYAGWAHSVLFASTLRHLKAGDKKASISTSKPCDNNGISVKNSSLKIAKHEEETESSLKTTKGPKLVNVHNEETGQVKKKSKRAK